MIPLGLKFWIEKSESGQPMMRLEPYVDIAETTHVLTSRPIDVFITYDGKRADDIAASRFAVRQLVAQAVCLVSLTTVCR
jgi:chromosome transmission fidelity protein 18